MNGSIRRRWPLLLAIVAPLGIAAAWAARAYAPASADAEALEHASAACAEDDQVGGCEAARLLFLAGDDGARRSARHAAKRLEAGCAAGRLRACAAAATALQQGFGVPAEPVRALVLAERACAGAVGAGCHVAGTVLRARGTRAEQVRALEAFAQGCLARHAASCSDLAGKDLAAAPPVPRLSALVERVRRHEPLAALDVIRADLRMLQILRNTVFAARGHRFQSSTLRAFFTGHGWYVPAGAVDEAALGDVDRRNLALLQAAEARDAVPLPVADEDQRLVQAIVEAPHEGAPLTEEERGLVGAWDSFTCRGTPAESFPVRCESYELFPDRLVLRRLADCRDPFVAALGYWRLLRGDLHVRWFAELRWEERGSMEESEEGCTGLRDVPPPLSALEKEEVLPTSPPSRDYPGTRTSFGGEPFWRHDAGPE